MILLINSVCNIPAIFVHRLACFCSQNCIGALCFFSVCQVCVFLCGLSQIHEWVNLFLTFDYSLYNKGGGSFNASYDISVTSILAPAQFVCCFSLDMKWSSHSWVVKAVINLGLIPVNHMGMNWKLTSKLQNTNMIQSKWIYTEQMHVPVTSR